MTKDLLIVKLKVISSLSDLLVKELEVNALWDGDLSRSIGRIHAEIDEISSSNLVKEDGKRT
jgi:hypothetical protein